MINENSKILKDNKEGIEVLNKKAEEMQDNIDELKKNLEKQLKKIS